MLHRLYQYFLVYEPIYLNCGSSGQQQHKQQQQIDIVTYLYTQYISGTHGKFNELQIPKILPWQFVTHANI